MTSLDGGQKSSMVFLSELKEEKLICWNGVLLEEEEFYANFVKFQNDFESVFAKIESDAKNMTDTEEKRQNTSFMIYVRYNYVISNLEIINKLLKLMVCKKAKIEHKKNTTLPQLIRMICEHGEYSKNYVVRIEETFCTNFINAITHHALLIDETGITLFPENIKKTKTYSVFELDELNAHVKGLLAGFEEFVNGENA
jgi:hypothetical protein